MNTAFEDLANAINELVELREPDGQGEEGRQIVLFQTPKYLAEEMIR